MFKIIRDFVEQPQFLMWCDCACGAFFTLPFTPATEEQRAAGLADQVEQGCMKQFVTVAMQGGWKVSLDRQLCPAHVKKEAGEISRILIPVGRFSPLNQ
jgi:hypothetical protein